MKVRLFMKMIGAMLLFVLLAVMQPGAWQLTDAGIQEPKTSRLTAYKVTFDTHGGSPIQKQTVKKGGKAVKPEDPTREGFIFNGWYIDADRSGAYDFNSKVTSDLTVYAKWKISGDWAGEDEESGLDYADKGDEWEAIPGWRHGVCASITKYDLRISPGSKTIAKGRSFEIEIRPAYWLDISDMSQNEWESFVHSAVDDIAYSSTKPDVASVNEAGLVKGKKKGTAYIKTLVALSDHQYVVYKTKVKVV